MNSLKITDFFETDLLHNFYYINDKDMSLCSLDSCHHTQSNNSLKNNKSLYSISNKDMSSGKLDSSGHT